MRVKVDWDQVALGVEDDDAVAARLGVPVTRVARARRARSIAAPPRRKRVDARRARIVAQRGGLWRRVHARLGVLGWTTRDLLDVLHPSGWTSTQRTQLAQRLRGRRGDGRPVEVDQDGRDTLCLALGLAPGRLDDDADPSAVLGDWTDPRVLVRV